MSQRVCIVTDSAADIPAQFINQYSIAVVPLSVIIDGQTYLDGVTLSAEAFYQKLSQTNELPLTSQPSPHDIAQVYQKVIEEGATQILSIHLSSALSGTYQSAVIAKGMIQDQVEIVVMDSKSASYVYGMAVVAAARAAQAGKSLAECQKIASYYLNHVEVFFLVDTLEYLQKGGRIGKAASLAGSLLNIKPILSINREGEVYAIEKVRGKAKAYRRIHELIQERVPEGPVSLALLHADRAEEAEKWRRDFVALSRYPIREEVITYIGPTIGAHAGPGTIAYVITPLPKEEDDEISLGI